MEIEIRGATTDDAATIAAIYAPFVLDTAISFEETPPTADQMAERIIKTTATHPWLVAALDGVVRGYAYAGFHRPRPAYRWSAEVTVYIEEGFHGLGLGKKLYQELFLELSRRGFVRLFAGIALPNPGSERLHEALGFERIGVFPGIGYKLGKWHDVAWYFHHLGDPTEPPKDPF